MTKEQKIQNLKDEIVDRAIKYIIGRRAYDDADVDASEHMMMENDYLSAMEDMEELVDNLLKIK